MRRAFGSALLLLSSLLGACAPDFDAEELELSIRPLPGKEGMAFLLVERGVHGSGENALTALKKVLDRRRRLPPDGGFISLDLDQLEKQPPGDVNGLSLSEFAKATRVQKAGLFLDEKGRLGVYQLWVAGKPELFVQMFNDGANRELIEQANRGAPFSAEFPWFDEASWKRAVACARENVEWLRLDDRGFVLDVPLSRESASRCLAALVEDEALRKSCGTLLAASSSLEVGEERTRIRFSTESSGWIRSVRCAWGRAYDDSLLTVVKGSRLPISEAPTLEAMDRVLHASK